MAVPQEQSSETRQRLLEAAGEVFAERGFRAATVRDICKRAGANIAAVNYHFGDKQELYSAVLRYAHGCASAEEFFGAQMSTQVSGAATPRQRLEAIIRGFVKRVLDHGRPAWHGKLMSREMVEPTAALDELVQHDIRPRQQMLGGIIRDLLGPAATPTLIRRCVSSIVGQIVFYHNCRSMLERLFPQTGDLEPDLDDLAAHIARFSLAGIKASVRVKPGKSPGKTRGKP